MTTWTTTHKLGLLVVLLAIVMALAPTFVRWRRNSFKPPEGVTTLADFAKAESPPRRLAAVKVNDDDYYVWLGQYVVLAAPSGPSCFVFNSKGRLVAYTATTGDGELAQYCDAAWGAPTVPIDLALRRTASNNVGSSGSADGSGR